MTSNPMFRENVMENVILDSKPMTVQGSINKTLFFLAVVILAGCFTWNLMAKGFSDKAMLIATVSAISGFVLALITSFKPNTAKITGSMYAVCEGLLLGSVSYTFEALYNGIVVNAVAITVTTLLSMLLLYKTKIIQATEKFRKVIFTATLGIAIYYLIAFIAGLMGHSVLPFGTLTGIAISGFICVIAALNFIMDFDFIERGSQNMAPDYYEWYGAFGLLVTLVWFYFEILRLLAQLNSRR